MSADGKRVLIVEDEALVAFTIEEALCSAGFEVCGIADRPAEALALALEHGPELAVVDVRLAAGGDGIELAHALAELGPTLILFATGNPAEVRRRARVGHGCLAKPFDGAWLIAALQMISGVPAEPGAIPGFEPLAFGRTG